MKARYTLNGEGAVLYTLAKAAGDDAFTEFKARCMNNLYNLRPRCASCNASRGNPLKFPAYMTIG